MRKSPYSDLLRHPRWQKKRLEIMQRDGFGCQWCLATDKTLNVHHLYYAPGRAPWEYEDGSLVTICEDCHSAEHDKKDMAEREFIQALRENRLTNDDLIGLAMAIRRINRVVGPSLGQQAIFAFGALMMAIETGKATVEQVDAFAYSFFGDGE